jgi:DNA-binding MarR family transcriptional regulator
MHLGGTYGQSHPAHFSTSHRWPTFLVRKSVIIVALSVADGLQLPDCVQIKDMMQEQTILSTENVAVTAAPAGDSRIYARYGNVASAGFQPLPDVLLFHQADLGLKSEDLNVLLNILAHWYHPESMPYLRTTTIAKRMGVSSRSVQRSILRLREKGLVARGEDTREGERFDITPLLQRLKPYAQQRIAIKNAMRGQFGMT